MPFTYGEVDIGKPSLEKIRPVPVVANRNPHGQLFLFESFEEAPLRWIPVLTGKSTIGRSFDRAYDGKCSLHLHVPDNTGGIEARRLFTHTADIISMECYFAHNYAMRTAVDGQALFFELDYYTGAIHGRFRLEYRPHFNQWVIWNGNPGDPSDMLDSIAIMGKSPINQIARNWYYPAYNETGYGNAAFVNDSWAHMKMIVNRKTGNYVGLELDRVFYDLGFLAGVTYTTDTRMLSLNAVWSAGLQLVEDATTLDAHGYIDAVSFADETMNYNGTYGEGHI